MNDLGILQRITERVDAGYFPFVDCKLCGTVMPSSVQVGMGGLDIHCARCHKRYDVLDLLLLHGTDAERLGWTFEAKPLAQ